MCKVMSGFYEKFGNPYLRPAGYVVEVGNSSWGHKFGGDSWKIVDKSSVEVGPVLLFVLDLSDPKLSTLGIDSLKELPICSYINSDVWSHGQVYKIKEETREAVLIKKANVKNVVLAEEDIIPNPLPEREIYLREMKGSEYPTDEESYWRNTDDLLGGESFFRVAGNPLWLQNVVKVKCSCGLDMTYVMSIGYEGWNGPFKYLDQAPFFIGEAALYVHFCESCFELKVISQSS